VLVVLNPRLAAVVVLDVELVLTTKLLEFLFEVFLDERRNVIGRLRWNKTDAELPDDLCRDDSLRANTIKGAFDSVKR